MWLLSRAANSILRGIRASLKVFYVSKSIWIREFSRLQAFALLSFSHGFVGDVGRSGRSHMLWNDRSDASIRSRFQCAGKQRSAIWNQEA